MDKPGHSFTNLARDEFASALQKGLGRAHLYVASHGLDAVADLVLAACLHDQAYDPQCEPSRAKWLFSMFNNSRHYPSFLAAIVQALRSETEYWDLQQLFELSREMVANGDDSVRAIMKERVYELASRSSEYDRLGAQEWIELNGLNAAIGLARVYGKRLLEDPEDFVPSLDVFPGYVVSRELQEMLFQYSKREPALKAYWDYLEARGELDTPLARENKRSQLERIDRDRREKHELESILQNAKNKVGEVPAMYYFFGQRATSAELQEVFSDLLKETDEEVCLRLLWVFRRAPIPRLTERLFTWAEGTNERLKEASIEVLAQTSDKCVHELARAKVQDGKILGDDSGVLSLFTNNYGSGDSQLITRALLSARPEMEDVHTLAGDIADLAERHKDEGLAQSLEWAYENTACSDCRYKIVVQIDAIRHLKGELLYECQFDAREDIKALARKQ